MKHIRKLIPGAILFLIWIPPLILTAQFSDAPGSARSPIITIGLSGDTMLARKVEEAISFRSYRYPWGDILPVIRATDINFFNLATTLTLSNEAVAKVLNFKVQPDRVKTLQEARIQVCSLANDHILDYSQSGLRDTIATLDAARIRHAGAGHDIAQAARPLKINQNGIRLGFVSISINDPEWSAGPTQGGTFHVSADELFALFDQLSMLDLDNDLLIVSVHWGSPMREMPEESVVTFAHSLVEAGADIIHGHGARLFQGVEIYEDRMILYDTGSIIDDFEASPTLRNDLCFFVRAQVDRKGLRRVEFVPVYKSKQQVNRAQGDAFRMGVRNLLKRSEPFKTQFLVEPDQLVLAPDAFGRWDI